MANEGELFKKIESETISLPTNKKSIIYFLDKTIITSWLKSDTNSDYVRAFMDLLYYAKAKSPEIVNVIIPVDVLLELKTERKGIN